MKRRTPLAAACAALLALAACRDQPLTPTGAPAAAPRATQELHTGFIQVEDDVWEIRYQVRNGRAIYQGDIDLGPAERMARTREELKAGRDGGGARRGIIRSASSARWPNGVVPYVIESNVGNLNISAAIAHIETANPGVNLVPRTTQSDYVIFRRTTDPDICGQSAIGRAGGGQVLWINEGADRRCIVHELGHALGMWHEQSRCDRDTYVFVDTANIINQYEYAFDKHCTDGTHVGGYDERSIMHYHKRAFGIVVNGVPLQTIFSLRGYDALLGTGLSLSTGDIYTLDWMYPPPLSITYLDQSGVTYHPIVQWNAVRTAVYYELYMVEEEYYRSAYGPSWTDTRYNFLDSTAGTELEDPYNIATGKNSCDYSNPSAGVEHRVDYTYEVVAVFPSGLTRTDRIGSQAAPC
jgi:hypothetical protein